MSWRIYYTDGKIFTNKDGSPEDAPLDGIQLIIENLDNGRTHYHCEREYYVWVDDHWNAGFRADYERWVRSITKRIKYGVETSNKKFADIMKEVNDVR